jgi:hypothetical protein
MTREEIEKGMDELARRCAETHAPEVKGKLEHLSHRLAERYSQIKRAPMDAITVSAALADAFRLDWKVWLKCGRHAFSLA